MVKDFGKVVYTLLYLKWMTSKDLLCKTGNSAQCYVPVRMGGVLGENGYMYMYGWVPSPSTWNYHNIVNPNTKCFWYLNKLKEKKEKKLIN